jgi:hypothetical protein
VVEPFLPDLDSLPPQVVGDIATGDHRVVRGVVTPRLRGHRAWASPPFRSKIIQ